MSIFNWARGSGNLTFCSVSQTTCVLEDFADTSAWERPPRDPSSFMARWVTVFRFFSSSCGPVSLCFRFTTKYALSMGRIDSRCGSKRDSSILSIQFRRAVMAVWAIGTYARPTCSAFCITGIHSVMFSLSSSTGVDSSNSTQRVSNKS